MLATTSIGAIWSSCGPDFGTPRRARPLLAARAEGAAVRGRLPVRRQAVRPQAPRCEKIIARLPTLEARDLPAVSGSGRSRAAVAAHHAVGRPARPSAGAARASSSSSRCRSTHPLWILFSSGTTGLPKPIMHSHGGILLEQLKHLHLQLRPARRRAHVLLHHHRLDDVELPGQLAAVGRGAGALRRQSGVAGRRRAVEDGGGLGPTLFGASPTYQAILEKAGIVPENGSICRSSSRSCSPARPSRRNARPGSTRT